MSKSLKNFITVKEMLRHISGRQARLLFAQRYYSDPFTFTPDLYDIAIKHDRRIAEWLQTPPLESDMIEVSPIVTEDPYDIPAGLGIIKLWIAAPPTVATQVAVRSYLDRIGIDYSIKDHPIVDKLITVRSTLKRVARETRNTTLMRLSDDLRSLIKKEYGIEPVDTASGITVRLS